jgi:hypothetical protein
MSHPKRYTISLEVSGPDGSLVDSAHRVTLTGSSFTELASFWTEAYSSLRGMFLTILKELDVDF